MTEREFITDAIGEILQYNTDEEWLAEKIDKFLEEYHKTYFEVEFISKQDVEEWKKSLTPIEIASMF